MLRVSVDENFQYILTEEERVSLASEEAKTYLASRIDQVEYYAKNKQLDFFTGLEVPIDDRWYFNVEKDGKIYECVYNNEAFYNDEVARECRALLMWRYADEQGFGYIEVIGNMVDRVGELYPVNTTHYNECREYKHRYNNRYEVNPFEELSIDDVNKEEIRSYFLYTTQRMQEV
jgi:hypothetical protein